LCDDLGDVAPCAEVSASATAYSRPSPIKGRITVVGACASGKSSLVARLLEKGYDARHCVQEHSFVPDMWQRQSRPEMLVYLDVSLAVILKRRGFAFSDDDLMEQRRRLAHARAHCRIYVNTDRLSEEQVLHKVLVVLETLGIKSPGS